MDCLIKIVIQSKWISIWYNKEDISLVAQIVKNLPAMQETPRFDPWVRKIPWRRA